MKQFTSILVSSILTAFIVVAAVTYLQPPNPNITNNNEGEEYILLSERISKIDNLLLSIQNDISAIRQQTTTQLELGNTYQELIIDNPGDEDISALTNESIVKNIASEEAVTENIITQLRDSSYAYQNATSEFLSSDEMSQLSHPSRERVIAELVRMLNNGEIDPNTFIK